MCKSRVYCEFSPNVEVFRKVYLKPGENYFMDVKTVAFDTGGLLVNRIVLFNTESLHFSRRVIQQGGWVN